MGALHALFPIVYDELHRQAARALRRERQDHTLQATALVNEVYLKLAGQDRVHWHNRAQFFGVAALNIRRILVDYERRRRTPKRGGGGVAVTLEDNEVPAVTSGVDCTDMLALDAALEELATVDERQVRLVELRYFVGFTIEETATALGVDPSTVKREWKLARAWLRGKLEIA